ncbi:HAMP domain-containing sensor histidine kinase [Lapillicoccus sp.]|uniref:sensor histidine kinase n=1 Tax=Lapillicoccus sp. TaxID=1909287 RepID=UPI0025E28DBC|nr:HAMP domain-containing sensor histidine kinase [Lapillicoccus sp.]
MTRSPGLATRLLAAQSLVLLAGALTTWLVASAVAPGIFRDHLQRAGVAHTAAEAGHVEDAFASALLIALAVALLVSVIIALTVTWYFTRRVQRSVLAVAVAASEIAEGRHGSRVPSPALGVEFDQLTGTVNQLTQRLEGVETTRRRMLADLAHEMRTPLATIDAHLEAIEDGVRALDDPTLAVLRGSTQRLGRLAQDVTAVSRAEEGQLGLSLRPTNPATLVVDAAQSAQAAFHTKGVRLATAVVKTPLVSADPERMAQVLGNLLDNALRHTPAGGTVCLTTSSPDPRWVEITVADTGEGIAREALDHVFDRFYRADPARTHDRGGSGIGLTISRALTEAHGGGIAARSPGKGAGATFVVRLPGLTVTTDQPGPPTVPGSRRRRGRAAPI